MQTTIKAPKAPKAAKPAPTDTVTQALAAVIATTPKPLSLRAESMLAHDTAGFTGNTYGGLSKPRNSGITKAPNVATSKATARTYAQLTERMHKTLAELATAYGAKPFALPGIDRGQAAIFLASGFFIPAGDARATLSADTIARYSGKATATPKA